MPRPGMWNNRICFLLQKLIPEGQPSRWKVNVKLLEDMGGVGRSKKGLHLVLLENTRKALGELIQSS